MTIARPVKAEPPELDRGPTPQWPRMLYSQDVELLGELEAGRPWFRIPGEDAEYEVRHWTPIPDAGPVRLTDGETYLAVWPSGDALAWAPTQRHPAGAFARGGKAAPVAPAKRKLKALRRIDALAALPLFARRRGLVLAAGVGGGDLRLGRADPVVERRGTPQARGWRECVERLNELGLTVVPVPGGRVTLASPGGGGGIPELLAAFAEVADWIAAGMAGKPWPCAWCKAEATTLLAGRVPACEEHGNQ